MTSNSENDLFAYLEKDCTTDLASWREEIVRIGKESLDDAVVDFTQRHNRYPDFADDDDSMELHDYVRECLDSEFSLSDHSVVHEEDVISAKGKFSALAQDNQRLLSAFIPGEEDRLCGTVVRLDSMPYMAVEWLNPNSEETVPTDPRQLNNPFGVHVVLKDAYVTNDLTREIMKRFDGDVMVAMNYTNMVLRREANVLSDQA